jgi:hypothetical protein
MPNYVTGNPLVTVAGFGQFLTDLEAQDTVVLDALTPLNKAVKARLALFEPRAILGAGRAQRCFSVL